MKRPFEVALGIVTSVGGFLEIGSLTTSAQAGAEFGYRLGWSIVLGTICLTFLIEMSGRFAAVSKHTITDAMRERFGVNLFAIPLLVLLAIAVLTLAAEMGGICVALTLATGLPRELWAIPVAFVSWLVLWRATFGVIENGVSLLGLVTVSFVVGAVMMHPDYSTMLHGFVPTLPPMARAHYWYVSVAVLGATISPFLYYFYASGAIEERWDASYLGTNRFVAVVGMGLGGFLSIAVLVLGSRVFHDAGSDFQRYQQLPLLLSTPLGRAGVWLVIASVGIACFGATLQVALTFAYILAQGFGWDWGENLRPRADARFSSAYTLVIAVAALFVLCGVDPLALTELTMVLTAAVLPIGVFPFLILMNDRAYLGEHTNGALSNLVVAAISALAAVLAVVTIPLELMAR